MVLENLDRTQWSFAEALAHVETVVDGAPGGRGEPAAGRAAARTHALGAAGGPAGEMESGGA